MKVMRPSSERFRRAEGDAVADHGLHLQLFAGRDEIFLTVERSQIARAVGAVDRILGVRQGALVEVGGEDFDGPILETALGFFEQQHAERVRLLARGTTRTPDAQPAQGEFGFSLQNFGNNDLAQGIQLGLTAKEASLANRDLVQQSDQLGLAHGLDSETLEILAQAWRLEFLHAPPAAIEQQAQLVIGMEDAGDLIYEVADAHQIRVGWPVRSQGRLHGSGCHAETSRIELVEGG